MPGPVLHVENAKDARAPAQIDRAAALARHHGAAVCRSREKPPPLHPRQAVR